MRKVIAQEVMTASGLVVKTVRYYPTKVAANAAAAALRRRCMEISYVDGTDSYPYGVRGELRIDPALVPGRKYGRQHQS